MNNKRIHTSFINKISYFNDQFSPVASLARVIRAPLFKDEPGSRGERFRVVSIKDFPPAGYLPTPQKEIILQNSAEKARRFVVEPYDLLVTIVGTIGAVTIVPEHTGPWIPATNMLVVRFGDHRPERSRAFYALIKSPRGRNVLRQLSHGQGIQIVSKKQFSAMLIPELNAELIERTEALWREELETYEESRRLLLRVGETFDALEREAPGIVERAYPARETIS